MGEYEKYGEPGTREYSNNVLQKLEDRGIIHPIYAGLWNYGQGISRFTKGIINIGVVTRSQTALLLNISGRVIEDQTVILGYQQANRIGLEQTILLGGLQRAKKVGVSQAYALRDIFFKEFVDIMKQKKSD